MLASPRDRRATSRAGAPSSHLSWKVLHQPADPRCGYPPSRTRRRCGADHAARTRQRRPAIAAARARRSRCIPRLMTVFARGRACLPGLAALMVVLRIAARAGQSIHSRSRSTTAASAHPGRPVSSSTPTRCCRGTARRSRRAALAPSVAPHRGARGGDHRLVGDRRVSAVGDPERRKLRIRGQQAAQQAGAAAASGQPVSLGREPGGVAPAEQSESRSVAREIRPIATWTSSGGRIFASINPILDVSLAGAGDAP